MTRRVKSFIEASSDMLDNLEKMLEESLRYLDISEQNELVDVYTKAGIDTIDAQYKVIKNYILEDMEDLIEETSYLDYLRGMPTFQLTRFQLWDIIEEVAKELDFKTENRRIVPRGAN